MKIEVKNIKTNMAFSEETICFHADVYINGKKVAYADNDGRGGSTNVMPYGIEHKKSYQDAQIYLSGIKVEEYGSKYSLEDLVDEVIHEYVNKREQDKFISKRNKDAEKHLVIYNTDEQSYSKITWGKYTIDQLLNDSKGRDAIRNSIIKYRKMGYKIFNTNIPSELLN